VKFSKHIFVSETSFIGDDSQIVGIETDILVEIEAEAIIENQ